MLKNIDILCQLQVLDKKIRIAEKEKERLPKEIEELEEKFNLEQESEKNIKQRLEQNLQQQKKLELNIAMNNQEINKYENQLLIVKTNKEYKALNSEITHQKEKNAEIEDQLIELLEAESNLEKEKNDILELLTKDNKILKKEKEKINIKIEVLTKEITQKEKGKIELSKKIPDILFRRYQRLIEHKDGKAIASIDNGICSGCHFRVRPQIIVEVAKSDSIITCENCSRILVSPKKTAKEN
ncbi:MAG: hypothetical protein KAW92_06045 [Candidatus Cloacimonetes bacterium]|nr:hypothetical protein [Candidatus Cloacimonadota bacterium]